MLGCSSNLRARCGNDWLPAASSSMPAEWNLNRWELRLAGVAAVAPITEHGTIMTAQVWAPIALLAHPLMCQ